MRFHERRSPGTNIGLEDVTRLEAALRHSEAFYSSLVETLPQSIFRKDRDGRFTFGNSRFCEALGKTSAEIIGKTDHDFFPAEVADKYQADDRAVMHGTPYEAVEYHPGASGERYVQVIKTPILNDAGECIGIQGIFWDVTERRMMEEQLHHERELLRSLLDTCPDAIYFKDRQSRFLRISRSLSAKIGAGDPANAIGKMDADFFGREHADAAFEDEQRIIASGEPVISKVEHERLNDGREAWVITTKVPMRDRSGQIVGTFGVSRDITELKQTEEALAIARDAAIESARLKAEFLANMSHEIRTPLNAIVGMSGLLVDTRLDAEQHDFAETIRTSADLLLGIVNDILDFSKIEAGKMSIEHIDFDLPQVIEETADLVANTAQKKGIELVTWIPPEGARNFRGDPSRIRQVIANLVNNAVKFTERGEVVLGVSLVGETSSSATVRVSIKDTGIGIPAEAQARLFNAFIQADGSTTRRYGGTGLGLAICKQLVALMGGEIGFDSVPGRGSTFWFTLPLEKPRVTLSDRPVDVTSVADARILIVDDNATNRDILHRQSSAWRVRDETAASGPEALAWLHRAAAAGDPFRIVILDMQMPDMDGFSVARAIHAEPKLRDTKIVILTSLAYHPNEAEFRRLGISAYLTKPVKQSRLLDSLATALNEPTSSGAAPPSSRAASAASAACEAKSLRILLAEDNRVNQKVTLSQLQKLGYHADSVANGQEVLDILKQAHYDVILMDCQMPEMDGYEATRQIREMHRAAPAEPRHHIVAITAHALQGDRERCLEAGMDDYVVKPTRLEDLAAALERGYLAVQAMKSTLHARS